MMDVTKGMRNPVFQLDSREQPILALAYIQMAVIKGLLYFATEKGKHSFAPVPAMIVAAIIKAVYKNEYGIMPHFLPQNRLDDEYPHYPREIFGERFWWGVETVDIVQKEMLAVKNIPEAMRVVVTTLIGEYSSVLHPNGLLGIRMASWWPMRPCGSHQDNLRVYLTEEHKSEVVDRMERLGPENATWCKTIGAIMGECMDDGALVSGRCSECHPTL